MKLRAGCWTSVLIALHNRHDQAKLFHGSLGEFPTSTDRVSGKMIFQLKWIVDRVFYSRFAFEDI